MSARRRHTPNSSFEVPNKENYPPTNHGYTNGSYDSPATKTFVSDDMSCRDRTPEFLSAVKSLHSRQQNGMTVQKRTPHRERSEFMQHAKGIGRNISNTFAKLEKLTILAKRKSLFDDKPVEIQELTYIIKQDINSLNQDIARLQEFVKSQRAINGKHLQTHSNSVVVALQSKLASMSNDFKNVLEVRTQNLKDQKSRREQFSQSPVSSSLPPSSMTGPTGSVLLNDEAKSAGDIAINMDHPMDKDRYQQQLQLIDEQDSYIQSRADTMQNIEQTIVELGGIFTQLAHMVKEQEEIVKRIDDHVDDTSLNVEAAHGEILKYFQTVTSNRWLMIKIFGVLIVFFIIFVVFMA